MMMRMLRILSSTVVSVTFVTSMSSIVNGVSGANGANVNALAPEEEGFESPSYKESYSNYMEPPDREHPEKPERPDHPEKPERVEQPELEQLRWEMEEMGETSFLTEEAGEMEEGMYDEEEYFLPMNNIDAMAYARNHSFHVDYAGGGSISGGESSGSGSSGGGSGRERKLPPKPGSPPPPPPPPYTPRQCDAWLALAIASDTIDTTSNTNNNNNTTSSSGSSLNHKEFYNFLNLITNDHFIDAGIKSFQALPWTFQDVYEYLAYDKYGNMVMDDVDGVDDAVQGVDDVVIRGVDDMEDGVAVMEEEGEEDSNDEKVTAGMLNAGINQTYYDDSGNGNNGNDDDDGITDDNTNLVLPPSLRKKALRGGKGDKFKTETKNSSGMNILDTIKMEGDDDPKELPLTGFDKAPADRLRHEKKYRTKFCKEIYWALENEEGIEDVVDGTEPFIEELITNSTTTTTTTGSTEIGSTTGSTTGSFGSTTVNSMDPSISTVDSAVDSTTTAPFISTDTVTTAAPIVATETTEPTTDAMTTTPGPITTYDSSDTTTVSAPGTTDSSHSSAGVSTTVATTTTTFAPETTEAVITTTKTAPADDTEVPPSTTAAAASTTNSTITTIIATSMANTKSTDAVITTASTTSTTSTTATSTSSTTKTTTTPPHLPFSLSFLASTLGNYDAISILEERNNNSILRDVTKGFWRLTLDILSEINVAVNVLMGDLDDEDSENEEGNNGERRDSEKQSVGGDLGEEASFFFKSYTREVMDVECPAGLIYAPHKSECLEFTFLLVPLKNGGPLTPETIRSFVNKFNSETNENGELYKSVIAINPNTAIVGLGNPGYGIPYIPVEEDNGRDGNVVDEASSSETTPSQIVEIGESEADTKEVQAAGFPLGGIIGVVVAFAVLLVAIIAFALRRRKRKEDKRLNEFAGDAALVDEDLEANSLNNDVHAMDQSNDNMGRHNNNNDDDSNISSIYSDGDDAEGGAGNRKPALEISIEHQESPRATAGSTLAAMGVASTAVTRLSTSPSYNSDTYSPGNRFE